MANIFVSHSSLDETRARRVFEALRRAGYDVFLDVDPDAGIAAGQSWEQEIYGRLRRCDAVVCIVTAAFVRSRWCFAEVALARSVGRPVFPLVLDRDAVEGLSDVLGGIQHVYWEPDEEAAAMERLAAGLRRRGLAPEDELPWDTPYPGFRPFDAGDAGVFFGRSSDVRRLTRLLEPSIE
ncbi:MAG: TIR domain-containing protein, partial [Gammaproteobacteria bacterium]|nr:toll/interleukin-1 receptor domain-containing protein [Gemmatimonadota bacterium]NIU79975.1 TIR domain-containing protein [Gammaproteobacteria bacterium]